MSYQMLTAEQESALTPEVAEHVTQTLLLTPARCIDCGQYVPLGWIEFGIVTCPQNVGATGVQYGHRIAAGVKETATDSLINAITGATH